MKFVELCVSLTTACLLAEVVGQSVWVKNKGAHGVRVDKRIIRQTYDPAYESDGNFEENNAQYWEQEYNQALRGIVDSLEQLTNDDLTAGFQLTEAPQNEQQTTTEQYTYTATENPLSVQVVDNTVPTSNCTEEECLQTSESKSDFSTILVASVPPVIESEYPGGDSAYWNDYNGYGQYQENQPYYDYEDLQHLDQRPAWNSTSVDPIIDSRITRTQSNENVWLSWIISFAWKAFWTYVFIKTFDLILGGTLSTVQKKMGLNTKEKIEIKATLGGKGNLVPIKHVTDYNFPPKSSHPGQGWGPPPKAPVKWPMNTFYHPSTSQYEHPSYQYYPGGVKYPLVGYDQYHALKYAKKYAKKYSKKAHKYGLKYRPQIPHRYYYDGNIYRPKPGYSWRAEDIVLNKRIDNQEETVEGPMLKGDDEDFSLEIMDPSSGERYEQLSSDTSTTPKPTTTSTKKPKNKVKKYQKIKISDTLDDVSKLLDQVVKEANSNSSEATTHIKISF